MNQHLVPSREIARYLAHGREPYGPGHNTAFLLYGACMAGMRAAAYAALKRWREALDDSHEVVTLKPEWVKGWVRRGSASGR